MALTEHTRKLFLRAVRQPQSPQIARNALALWLYLDTEYPKCEFQRSMVPISDSDEPLFGELILEADTAGAHLLARSTRLQANQVDSVLLVKTRTVLINRDFALLPLFLNKDGSRERLLLFVTICQNVRADLGVEPPSHQHAQIEVGHQEQHAQNEMGHQEHKRSTVDVDGRTLQIHFMKGYPVSGAAINDYITSIFGDCIETIVIEEDDPPRTGTIVLQTPEDVTRVMAGTKFNSIQVPIQNKFVWFRSKKENGDIFHM